jgi:tetratricopeptide (TPR) repeat protein
MKKQIILIILISCFTKIGLAQEPDNTKPMYGNIEKDEKLKIIDNEFIETVTKQFGTRDSASKVYVSLGWRYLITNNKTASIKRFNQAWLLNPSNCDVYYGFYALENLDNNENEANNYFAMGQKYDKENIRALKAIDVLTSIYAQTKQNKKVYEMCFKMIALDSNFLESYRTLGYYYAMDNDTANAIKYYNLAISKNPNDTFTIINRGCYYQSQKQYENALKDFERTISMNKDYLQGYSNRGLLQFEQRNYDLAIKDFEFVLNKTHENEKGYYYRMIGLSTIKLGNKEGGCEYLKLAKKYGDYFLGNDSLKQLIKENCK